MLTYPLNDCIDINNSKSQLLIMSGSTSSYRDRIYIVEDIILKLVEYGELNQTALVSFCGLNLKKHKSIIDELELNKLISKSEAQVGKRIVTIYRPTQKGIEFCRSILEPYEKMFPRRKNITEEQDKNYK
jgi:predicted transcriptional regulator